VTDQEWVAVRSVVAADFAITLIIMLLQVYYSALLNDVLKLRSLSKQSSHVFHHSGVYSCVFIATLEIFNHS